MITVLLADDEPLICDELKFLLSQERDVRILEQCFSGNEALEKFLLLNLTWFSWILKCLVCRV